MMQERDKLHCPACGRLIKKIEGLCPFCGANPKDAPSQFTRKDIEKEHLKSIKNIRFHRKDKHHGMKKG
ncbi:MAG: hypothetical protein M1475_06030 [Actinobacteria bacterium]|nr:hypothetical protein [Actinomycetota bacterium]MCL6087952.1 hypothetical protein [Actinomycetota bacterium]